MYSSTVFSIFCFVLYVVISESAPLSNEIPRYFNVSTLLNKYKNYIQSPPPCDVVVRTRDLLAENVREVQPAGIVLRRCPTSIPTVKDSFCYSTESIEVTLQVRIKKVGSAGMHKIITTEDVSCSCGT